MGLLDSIGGNRRGGISPVMVGLMGLLAYRTLKGKGKLADMLGTGGSGSAGAAGGALSGGALAGGLKDLLDRFREGGHEEQAQSWVSKGPNKPIDPTELAQSLGEERIEWLVEQTGLPRDQLLAGLSGELPNAIDKLTPHGRIPTDEELSH
ncbi:YidB family protein [Steroidobacter cummioxidans]|uniref:YidB family protein n=1 Tax=Steroidobacter cummioxidans TaxID=1803913 RepID=UPI000E30CE10|nr:YidB family protein [Steroidobacter cummioxidans]